MRQLRLSTLIAPEYYRVHRMIWSGEYTEDLEDGGRGSLKSTFAATEHILLIMRVPNIHGIVLRKVANTIVTSVWPEYNRVIDRMGIRDQWRQTKKPYTLTYRPTGQTIQFYGLDDPGKLKSLAAPFGYFGVCHFEEYDQYDGPEEIRSVEQSVFRGGPFSFAFKTYNSPAMARHWVNRYKREIKPKQIQHHTTYLTTPPEWLGQRFFDDAETLRQRDPVAYAHEYLGEVVGCGTAVFDNLELREISREEIAGFDRVYCGLDWGWYPDPNHFGAMSYDSNARTIYIWYEHRANREKDEELAAQLDRWKSYEIIADSAGNKSIATLRDLGYRKMRGCYKYAAHGGTSVTDGMKWLQSRAKIVIDPKRCPYTAREFSEYEYPLDKKTQEVLDQYIDADNHSIDMTRYALEPIWQHRGLDNA
jgi:phage terminase large subunit